MKNWLDKFWRWLDGKKTRIVTILGTILSLVVVLNPTIVSTAFNLGVQGSAIVTLTLFILSWLSREFSKTPGVFANVRN